jgi:hypothetical protein
MFPPTKICLSYWRWTILAADGWKHSSTATAACGQMNMRMTYIQVSAVVLAAFYFADQAHPHGQRYYFQTLALSRSTVHLTFCHLLSQFPSCATRRLRFPTESRHCSYWRNQRCEPHGYLPSYVTSNSFYLMMMEDVK